ASAPAFPSRVRARPTRRSSPPPRLPKSPWTPRSAQASPSPPLAATSHSPAHAPPSCNSVAANAMVSLPLMGGAGVGAAKSTILSAELPHPHERPQPITLLRDSAFMPLLAAIERDIDPRHRIGRQHLETIPRNQCLKPFLRASGRAGGI